MLVTFSVNYFALTFPVKMLTCHGKKGDNNQYHGGTIFNYMATGAIWVEIKSHLVLVKL